MEGDCVAQIGNIFEFSKYTIKDWVQLVAATAAIFVSVLGAWKAWRFSKKQMVNRLFEYLNTDEKHVAEGRSRILGHLGGRETRPLGSGVEIHATIEKAIRLLDSDGPVEA